MPELYAYRVGKPYSVTRRKWEDGTDFNYRSNVLELRMFFSKLSGGDIRAIKNGPAKFAFTVIDDIIYFLFEFGRAVPLSDNNYTIHLVPENERTIPPILETNEHAMFTIFLVSSEDGILQAIRQISLPPAFSEALYDAIRTQANKPFNTAEHDKSIAATYAKYPAHLLLQKSMQEGMYYAL